MQIDSRTRLVLAAHAVLFVVLLFSAAGMLAWLSEHYKVRWDWTAASRNTLTAPSRMLLERLDGPIEITAYVREEPLIRQSILQLLERYQRHKQDIELRFVNPDLVPDEVRARNVSSEGEMVIRYRQHEEHARMATEEALTTALEKLARADTRWITYLGGHGERDLLGGASYDLGRLGERLERQGFKLHRLDLAETGEIPPESAVLVISPGRDAIAPKEIDAVLRYLEAGGNLLWLAEPGTLGGLGPLAEALGVRFEAGTLVDPTTRNLGIAHPAFVPVSAYPTHPITANLELVTVFPHAAGIAWSEPPGWQTRGILSTGLRAWSETGPLDGKIGYDDGLDVAGPLDIGIAMERTMPAGEDRPDHAQQRVVVVGDGDFLSNAYLGNGSNFDLAMNIFNWLAEDEALIDIPARSAPDLTFELSGTAAAMLRLTVMIVLPALLLGAGFLVWQRRRRL